MLDFIPMITPERYMIEEWFPISPIFFHNIKPGYLISTWGRVQNQITGQLIPNEFYDDTKNRYITVYLSTTDNKPIEISMHVLMAYIFMNEAYSSIPNVIVNHIDTIRYHNWIWNLECVTQSENIKQAFKSGVSKKGEFRYNSSITNEQAFTIARLIASGVEPSIIDKSLKSIIPNVNIYDIARGMKNGMIWQDVMKIAIEEKEKRNYSINNFSDNQIRQICMVFEKYGKETSTEDVLKNLGINIELISKQDMKILRNRIYRIRNKLSYTEISSAYNF